MEIRITLPFFALATNFSISVSFADSSGQVIKVKKRRHKPVYTIKTDNTVELRVDSAARTDDEDHFA